MKTFEIVITIKINASSAEEAERQANLVVDNINTQAYTTDDFSICRHDARIGMYNDTDDL